MAKMMYLTNISTTDEDIAAEFKENDEKTNQAYYEASETAQDVAGLKAKLPDAPTTQGVYVLAVTINAQGKATYSWETMPESEE